jgi:hypothetical protein
MKVKFSGYFQELDMFVGAVSRKNRTWQPCLVDRIARGNHSSLGGKNFLFVEKKRFLSG